MCLLIWLRRPIRSVLQREVGVFVLLRSIIFTAADSAHIAKMKNCPETSQTLACALTTGPLAGLAEQGRKVLTKMASNTAKETIAHMDNDNDNDNDILRKVPHPSNEGLASQARVKGS